MMKKIGGRNRLLILGGWNDCGHMTFSKLRKAFINMALKREKSLKLNECQTEYTSRPNSDGKMRCHRHTSRPNSDRKMRSQFQVGIYVQPKS